VHKLESKVNNLLMLRQTKVAVCCEIRTEHIKAMWPQCRIFEC